MPLLTQSPSQFVTSIQNSIVATVTRARNLNFTPGSVFAALVNAFASQLAFMQNQMVYQVSVTRAATSNGADLTSFCADYLLNPPRLPAIAPFGQVTFGKYQTSSSPISIPVGTVIQTSVQPPAVAVQYQVVADLTNPNYNAATNAYILPALTSTILVTCAAILPPGTTTATQYNVAAGALVVLVTPGILIDYVTNPNAILNGLNQETDAALRVRFQNYISGLSAATVNAIAAAVLGVQVGLTYSINDELNAVGSAAPGYFTVVVDDGSGAIPGATLAAVSAAVNLVRASGISYYVIAPTNVPITVALTGTTIQPGFNAAAVRAAIQAAIVAYINANGVGGGGTLALSYVGIGTLIGTFIGTAASQGLASYASLTVNSGTVNVPLNSYQLARTSNAGVTIS